MNFERKKFFCGALIIVAAQSLITTGIAVGAHPALAKDLRQAMQSVVSVLPVWPRNVNRQEEPEGSGVVINEGNLIVTARHVVDKAISINIRTRSGEILPAKAVGDDRHSDIALLEVSQKLQPIVFSNHDPELGEHVCGIGNAFGLGLSISCGVVSGLNKSGIGFNRIEDFVQTDAAINPGASGGALVNRRGELVGLISAIFTKKSDANIGINFAVSTRLLNRVIPDLIQHGRVSWPNLGLVLSNIAKNREVGKVGARIKGVRPGSFADRAQFKAGDLILKVGKQRIRSGAELISAMSLQTYGKNVDVQLRRNDRILVLHTPSY